MSGHSERSLRERGVLRRFTAVPLAVFVVVALVAVPTTAARLITGKDVKDSSLTGKDVKNGSLSGADVKDGSLTGTDVANSSLTGADVRDGSIGAADLSAGAAATPATMYGTLDVAIPSSASTLSPSGGLSSVEIVTTRPGAVMLIGAMNSSATLSASGPAMFELGAALFVDGQPIEGAAATALAMDINIGLDEVPPSYSASLQFGFNGLVIDDLAVGAHDIEIRYWHVSGSSATATASMGPFTVLELG